LSGVATSGTNAAEIFVIPAVIRFSLECRCFRKKHARAQ
jgi:hypothetical protein